MNAIRLERSLLFFFFNDTATTEIYTLSLHDALPIFPSGRAQKPGDVQIAMSGKSIEVINTDAEGRLVLADAVTYARQLGATHLVDAATPTGPIHVALGGLYAGAFTNNQKFLDAFLASARAAGEKFWPRPLDDESADNIKSGIADN